ncbi:MAG TPA: hypothetical protein VII11_02575 [Bacteroidota bacterium]
MTQFVVIIIGLFFGLTVLSVLIDIIFFDIPFTIKLSKTKFINSRSILIGSTVSLFLWTLIFTGTCLLIYFFFVEQSMQFIVAIFFGGIWTITRKKKPILMERYFKKHKDSIAPTLSIILYNREGFDFEGVKKLLNAYLSIYDKQIK